MRIMLLAMSFSLLLPKLYAQTEIKSLGGYIWNIGDEPKTFAGKLQLSFVSADQGFPNYGTVIAGGGYNNTQDGSAFQLYIPYSSTYGGSSPRIRMGLYNNQGWSDWSTFYTSTNANSATSDWKAKTLLVYDKIGIGTTDPMSKLAIVSNTNGWMITSKATVTTAGETNGIKLLTGYPNDTNKWAAIAAIAEDLHSNNTGLALYSSANERIRIAGNGNVGIGTSTPKAKLAVEGNIVAREIKVVANIEAPDYVFEPDYKMLPLTEVEKYVKENRHLPEIPSAKQIKRDGLDLAEMNLLLLKKVEELTLHQIDLLKELQQLKSELSNHLNENHNK
ncbi:tail fiber protein [Olivibacter sp. SA151]|uniref:hypothetical protein n=1 Tax=Olivibacter jilunii TaxID=985016 RepID=UPI003F13FF1E